MKEDLDLFDSPGPYQVCSGVTGGPPKHQLQVELVFGAFFDDEPGYVYLLKFLEPRGLYIRKRWWGRIQTTSDRELATKWDSHEEARAWAVKRKLDVY